MQGSVADIAQKEFAMSLTLRTTGFSRRKPVTRAGHSLAGLWRAVRDGLKRMERASALRRELDRMDDRMLSDIGVSRAQLEFETDRRS